MGSSQMLFKDGTPFEPPEDPLLHDPKYKKQERWGYDCPAWGYGCMFCSKCPMSDTYKYSEEEQKIEEEFKIALKKYCEEGEKLHGEIMIQLNDPLNADKKEENMETVKIKPEPFEFVSKILDMSLETQMEIYPETGSTENIFKYFTFEEALERYNNWYNGSSEEK